MARHRIVVPEPRSVDDAGNLIVPTPPPDGPDPTELEDEDLNDVGAFNDARYTDYLWYVWRRHTGGPVGPRSKNSPKVQTFVATYVGQLDLARVSSDVGGGAFRIMGYLNGVLHEKLNIDFEGPPKVYDAPEPAAPRPAAPFPAPTPQLAGDVGALILNRLAELERKMANPAPAAAAPQVFGLNEVLSLVDRLRPSEDPASRKVQIESMLQLLQTGVNIGQGRPVSVGDDDEESGKGWPDVIHEALPVIRDIVANIPRPRGAAPPPASAPPAPAPSSATVVEEPAPPALDYRWLAAVDALARAIVSELPAGDFAMTLETLLHQDEIFRLKSAPTAMVMTEVRKAAAGQLPILDSQHAEAYVDQVLRELREPSEADGEGEGDG